MHYIFHDIDARPSGRAHQKDGSRRKRDYAFCFHHLIRRVLDGFAGILDIVACAFKRIAG